MAKEFQKALEILDTTTRGTQVHRSRSSVWEPADPLKTVRKSNCNFGVACYQHIILSGHILILYFQINAQIFLLRGKIYEAMMNRILAAQSYKEALAADIYCVEAFDLLTQHQMLSATEGNLNFNFNSQFLNITKLSF